MSETQAIWLRRLCSKLPSHSEAYNHRMKSQPFVDLLIAGLGGLRGNSHLGRCHKEKEERGSNQSDYSRLGQGFSIYVQICAMQIPHSDVYSTLVKLPNRI